jgi:hypothetical protein
VLMAAFKELNHRTPCFRVNYRDNNIINNLITNLLTSFFLRHIDLNNTKRLGFISLRG